MLITQPHTAYRRSLEDLARRSEAHGVDQRRLAGDAAFIAWTALLVAGLSLVVAVASFLEAAAR